jgi:hypothetical protein
MVLGWFELPDEDQPPQEIWLDDEKLAAHFEKVRDRYRSASGNSGMESVPQADLPQNELTASFKRK